MKRALKGVAVAAAELILTSLLTRFWYEFNSFYPAPYRWLGELVISHVPLYPPLVDDHELIFTMLSAMFTVCMVWWLVHLGLKRRKLTQAQS